MKHLLSSPSERENGGEEAKRWFWNSDEFGTRVEIKSEFLSTSVIEHSRLLDVEKLRAKVNRYRVISTGEIHGDGWNRWEMSSKVVAEVNLGWHSERIFKLFNEISTI